MLEESLQDFQPKRDMTGFPLRKEHRKQLLEAGGGEDEKGV